MRGRAAGPRRSTTTSAGRTSTGDAATALAYWKKALAQREAAGNEARIRIAKWTVARGLRATGALDDAQAIQMALVAETERDHAPDGYVYEELAEIALARGDAKARGALGGEGARAAQGRPGARRQRGARASRASPPSRRASAP